MSMTPPLTRLALWVAGVSLAATSLTAVGCGKAPNDTPVKTLEFPRSLPAAPLTLTTAQAQVAANTWTSGRAIANGPAHLWLVDRDNGQVVQLERETLRPITKTDVGSRPEQIVVAPSGRALVTVRDSGELVKLDVDGSVIGRIALGGETWGLALTEDGNRAYVSLPYNDRVAAIDVATMSLIGQFETPRRPRGLVLGPDGRLTIAHQADVVTTLALASDGLLPAFDDLEGSSLTNLRRGNPAERLEMLRVEKIHTTRALAATHNPSTGGALIAHMQLVPGTFDDFVANQKVVTEFDDPNVPAPGSGGGDGYGNAGTSRGGAFDIPFRPAEATVTGTGLDGSAQVSAAFPVQDPWTGEPMTHLVDQPSDINHHPTHTLAFMVGYGSDNVLVLNTAGHDPMVSPIALISVGRAPQAITFSHDGNTAWVLNSFDFTVSAIDLTPLLNARHLSSAEVNVTLFGVDSIATSNDAMMPPAEPGSDLDLDANLPRMHPLRLNVGLTVAFNDDPWDPAVRRGARVFTFARSERMSHAGQFACATCHFEGTEDGQVWFIGDGPRQTPALAERLVDTAPFNWNGSEDLLKNNMERTVGRLGGSGLNTGEINDLEEFMLHGLRAPSNPNIAEHGLTDEQLWGKTLFNDSKVGCVTCHRDAALTDGFSHDVGTASEAERIAFDNRVENGLEAIDAEPEFRLNTPSLKGLWYTAPYLHDGSAKTLMEVLDKTAYTMGETHHLSYTEKEALVAYLKTL